jgi:cAMP-dependent protein kinase regulator
MSRTATTQEEVKNELEGYLQEKGISNLFIHVVETMLLYKPDNPIQFIIDHLKKNYPDQVTGGDGTAKSSVVAAMAEKLETDLLLESDDEDEDDDDLITSVKAIPIARRTRRRTAVSSAVFGKSEFRALHPPVYEKTADQRQRLREILLKNMLFQNCSPESTEKIIDAFEPREFEKDKAVITQGEESSEFFILEKGTASVWVKKDEEDEAKKLLTYEEGCGASFGDLALMYRSPSGATVKGDVDLKMFCLNQAHYKKLVVQDRMDTYEQYIEFLKDVKILRTVTDVERQLIASALIPLEFNAGQVIMRQGDKGDNFYIVQEGEVVCTQQDSPQHAPKEVLRLSNGGYFGEIALLTNRPRQATVTAVRHSKVLQLDRARFKRVMGPLKEILRRNLNFYKTFVTEQM